MKTIAKILLTGALLSGCAQGADIHPEKIYGFDPQGELLQRLVPLAAQRWQEAGCMDIQIGFGVPWTIEADIPKNDTEQATGATDIDFKTSVVTRVRIHEKTPDKWSAILHEMAHAFGIPEHAKGHGVFSNEVGHSEAIDEESLSKVCEWVECGCFNPEGN